MVAIRRSVRRVSGPKFPSAPLSLELVNGGEQRQRQHFVARLERRWKRDLHAAILPPISPRVIQLPPIQSIPKIAENGCSEALFSGSILPIGHWHSPSQTIASFAPGLRSPMDSLKSSSWSAGTVTEEAGIFIVSQQIHLVYSEFSDNIENIERKSP